MTEAAHRQDKCRHQAAAPVCIHEDAGWRLAIDCTITPDWIDLAVETDPGDIETAAAAALLESETFNTEWTFDALGRVTTQTTPDTSVTTQTLALAASCKPLRATSISGDTIADPTTYSNLYAHDVHSNMTAMPHIDILTFRHSFPGEQ